MDFLQVCSTFQGDCFTFVNKTYMHSHRHHLSSLFHEAEVKKTSASGVTLDT